MRWVVLALLLSAAPLQAQSLKDFPTVNSVSRVTVVGTFLYFNLEPVLPKQPFRDWWTEMEECTGVEKPFDGVAWYVASVIYNFVQRREAWGIYYYDPAEIVIVARQGLAETEATAKHEILHHLLHNTDHDEANFTRCLPVGTEH